MQQDLKFSQTASSCCRSLHCFQWEDGDRHAAEASGSAVNGSTFKTYHYDHYLIWDDKQLQAINVSDISQMNLLY